MASKDVSPTEVSMVIMFLIPYIFSKDLCISLAFTLLIPFISAILSASDARTSSVSSPKAATILSAIFTPIPGRTPPERYFIIPASSEGKTLVAVLTLNCLPKVGWLAYSP